MAVYETSYRRYAGPLTSPRARWTVIPRYAWDRLVGSKLVIALLVLSVVTTLGAMVLIYVGNNLKVLEVLGLTESPLPIDIAFFSTFLSLQLFFGFLLVLIAGPPLISMDLANGALPLYLARPISRREYVLGKFAVLAAALSAFTWVPALLLFGLQAALAGGGWAATNARIAGAVTGGAITWILVMSFLTLALSAWIRWPLAVRGVLLVVFFVLPGFAAVFNEALDTRWGNLISLGGSLIQVIGMLFGVDTETGPPGAAAWGVAAAAILLSVWLLNRKLEAYEVVS